MKYTLFIYMNEADWAGMTEAEQARVYGAFSTLTEDLKRRGQYVAGEELQPTATASTVRLRNGRTLVTDGPFAETKEQLGGFYIVEVEDLDAALAIAARIPLSEVGSVEVRPIQSMGA